MKVSAFLIICSMASVTAMSLHSATQNGRIDTGRNKAGTPLVHWRASSPEQPCTEYCNEGGHETCNDDSFGEFPSTEAEARALIKDALGHSPHAGMYSADGIPNCDEMSAEISPAGPSYRAFYDDGWFPPKRVCFWKLSDATSCDADPKHTEFRICPCQEITSTTTSPTDSPTSAPTSRPTASPSSSPTSTPPSSASSSAPTASAVGDPHMRNILGQRFDLAMPGKHVLIQVPKEPWEHALLTISADVARMSASCADMYIQTINITGAWLKERGDHMMAFKAKSGEISKGWMPIGKVMVKIVRGATKTGIHYLNMFTKHLSNTGLSVGGILGEGDHTKAATPTDDCRKTVTM